MDRSYPAPGEQLEQEQLESAYAAAWEFYRNSRTHLPHWPGLAAKSRREWRSMLKLFLAQLEPAAGTTEGD